MKNLILVLCVSILLASCAPAPKDVVDSWQKALNEGRIDEALSYLTDDATVTIISPAQGDGIYSGREEIRGWYETIAAGKGSGALRGCITDGNTLTCVSTYADEGLKAMGVDFIEGNWEAVIQNGKIKSYIFTITPESLAKFPPPEPVEALAGSVAELLGVWWFPQGGMMIEFKEDGTYTVFSGSAAIGQIDEGPYTFEAGKITAIGCNDKPATYEAYLTVQEGTPTKLRMQVVGQDSCIDRANVLQGIGQYRSPTDGN